MRYENENLKYYFISSALILSVFFLIPFELYYNQQDLWNYSTELPVSLAAVGLFCAGVLILVLLLLRKYGEGGFHVVSLISFCLGIYLLLADACAPLKTTLLDGTTFVAEEPLGYTLLELFFLILLFGGLITLKRQTFLPVAVLSTAVLLAVSFGYAMVIIVGSRPEKFAEPLVVPERKIKGNIYHFVLDEMQTDAAITYFMETEAAVNFKGFTLYPYNTSNYLYTKSSFPSYITGTLYQGKKSFRGWQESFKNSGLFKDLHRSGYRLSMYAPLYNWNNRYLSEFSTLDGIINRATGELSVQCVDYLHLWLARLMPNLLVQETIRATADLAEQLCSLVRRQSSFPDTIAKGKEPYASVLMLRDLIEKEKERSATGEYIYVHAIFPHGPYVFQRTCEYDSSLNDKKTFGYFNQVQCSFKLLIEYLNELKRLDRYDSSTIVIQADTGHGHRGFISRRGQYIVGSAHYKKYRKKKGEPYFDNPVKWRRTQILARSAALLMLKPAEATAPLRFSERRSQLIDIYPSLLDLLDLATDNSDIDGISLLSDNFPEKRDALVYYYPPDDTTSPRMKQINLGEYRLFDKMDVWLRKGKRIEKRNSQKLAG